MHILKINFYFHIFISIIYLCVFLVTVVTILVYIIGMPISYSNNQLKITLALYKILYKKPIEKITVSEICYNAQVSRMSFYRNFSSIEDIFLKYCDDRFEEFYEIVHNIKDPTGYTFYLELFKYLKKYSRQIQALKRANRESLLIKQFKSYAQYLLKKIDESGSTFIQINPLTAPFVSGGVYNILIAWTDNQFNMEPEEMAKYLVSILSKE